MKSLSRKPELISAMRRDGEWSEIWSETKQRIAKSLSCAGNFVPQMLLSAIKEMTPGQFGASGELLTQLAAENFAGSGLGHSVDEVHLPRLLVVSEAICDKRAEFLFELAAFCKSGS